MEDICTELGKSSDDAKGNAIRVIPKMRNTDALEDGGSASSSVEAPVMGVERCAVTTRCFSVGDSPTRELVRFTR
jgi:hypothetical protein